MRRLIPAVLAVPVFLTSAALAQTANFRLYSPEANPGTSPSDLVVSTPLKPLLSLTPAEFLNGTQLVSRAVTYAEGVVRRPAPRDATNAQRQDLADRKRHDLMLMLRPIPARAATFSFEVLDVIKLPVEERPRTPAEQIEATRTSMMAVGRLAWSSPTLATDAERRAMAAVTGQEQSAQSQLRREYLNARGEDRLKDQPQASLELDRQTIQTRQKLHDDARREVSEMRARLEARKPAHLVYVIGSPADFAGWRRGQTRSGKVAIQKVGLYVYNQQTEDLGAEDRAQSQARKDLHEAPERKRAEIEQDLADAEVQQNHGRRAADPGLRALTSLAPSIGAGHSAATGAPRLDAAPTSVAPAVVDPLLTQEDLSAAYVGLEFVVVTVPDAAAAARR